MMAFAIISGLLPGRPVAGLSGGWCSPGVGEKEPAIRTPWSPAWSAHPSGLFSGYFCL